MIDTPEAPEKECEVKLTKRKPPEPKKPEIPNETLMEFIGKVPDFHKVDCHNIVGNKFRVNVWTKLTKDDCVIPKFNLPVSYFVDYDVVSDTITDETISRASTPDVKSFWD